MIQRSFSLEDLPERYAFLDPAGTRAAASRRGVLDGCRASINVVGVDSLERVFWLHAWAGRLSNVSELLERIYQTQRVWQPQVFGCEANAMQSLFAEMVELHSRDKQQWLPLAAVTQPGQIDKKFRIRCLLSPVVGEGRLFVSKDIPKDCLAEVTGFPLTPKMDVVDGLASAVGLIPPRERQVRGLSDRMQREYERETGVLYGEGSMELEQGEFDPFAEFRG